MNLSSRCTAEGNRISGWVVGLEPPCPRGGRPFLGRWLVGSWRRKMLKMFVVQTIQHPPMSQRYTAPARVHTIYSTLPCTHDIQHPPIHRICTGGHLQGAGCLSAQVMGTRWPTALAHPPAPPFPSAPHTHPRSSGPPIPGVLACFGFLTLHPRPSYPTFVPRVFGFAGRALLYLPSSLVPRPTVVLLSRGLPSL